MCLICVENDSTFSLLLEKLLIASRKPEDYGFLVKGCYTVDGIDDEEEFKATEVKNFYLFSYVGQNANLNATTLKQSSHTPTCYAMLQI